RTAKLVKFYVPGGIIASNRPEPFRGLRVDHASVWYQRLSGFERYRRGIPSGVCVGEVRPGSPAKAAGLRVEDVITVVDGRAVTSPNEFYQAVKKLSGAVELTLINPEGQTRKLKVE